MVQQVRLIISQPLIVLSGGDLVARSLVSVLGILYNGLMAESSRLLFSQIREK